MVAHGKGWERGARCTAMHSVGHDRRSLFGGVGGSEDVLNIVCRERASWGRRTHGALLQIHGYRYRAIRTNDGRVHGDPIELAIRTYALLNKWLWLVLWMRAVPALHVVSRREMRIARLILTSVGHPSSWLLRRSSTWSLVEVIHVVLQKLLLLSYQLGWRLTWGCWHSEAWAGEWRVGVARHDNWPPETGRLMGVVAMRMVVR